MRRTRRAGPALGAVAAAAALGGLVLTGPTATGVGATASARRAPVTTLALELNEPPGATTAADSSGMNHPGAIGSHIRMSGSYGTWDRHSPDAGIYYGAAHLVMVPDAADGSLDPGAGNFSVEIRYRTTVRFGNVIQKGQATTSGGQVKFEQPNGIISCLFRSPTGKVGTGSLTSLNDGRWHVVRCDRTSTQVTMYVDGAFRSRVRKNTGTIDNKKPWTIGGKFDCDTSDPTVGADSCDYFAGDIDYVHLTKG